MEKIEQGDNLSQSENIVETNIDKLKALFPEIVTEGKIDFKVLQEVLGNELEEGEEYYRFTWAGKANARREAQKPSTGTLRPAPEESVDWDTTQNLYIEGDNLEVLKLLQKSYAGKIKMIYIDPPYNTGKDFVYKDNYKDNLRNYQEVTGQIDDEGNKLSTNSDSDGRYHSNWLNMMYPRLRLARNLLKEDGVIFMSIDENEVENLKKISNEIFGENNYAGEIIWKNSSKNDQAYISIQHEYFLFYVKNKEKNKGEWIERKEGLEAIYKAFEGFQAKHGNDYKEVHKEALKWFKQFPESNPIYSSKHYSWMDEKGVYFPDNISGPNFGQYRYDVVHPTTGEVCKEPASGWRYPETTMEQRIKDNLVHFGDSHTTVPNNKTYLKNTELQSLVSVKYKDGRVASKNLTKLMGENIFTNPKDLNILCDIFKSIGVDNDDIILDFFSGSGTVAESVFSLNSLQGSKCKFILVQLQENLNEILKKATGGAKATTTRAINFLKKHNLPINICELAKMRINKANSIYSQDCSITQDLGFKVFKLDTSNIKGWDGNPENLDESLFDAQDNIKTDRTEHDVLYEILLKYGLDLTLPIEEKQIEGKTVFSVGFGALFICLADTITSKVAEGIGAWKEELQPEVCRVVFKDTGFTDVEKTNSIQILKRFGISEIKSI